MLPKGTQWRTPALDQAIASSDELVLETNLGADAMAQAQTMMRLGVSPNLPPLAERVPEEKRPALAAMIQAAGVPAKALDRLETWAAALTLAAVSFKLLGLDPDLGVEKTLTGAGGKPVRGLETVEEQLGFFDTLPEASQRAFLSTVLDDPAEARAQFAAMLAAWSHGDVDAIAATFNSDVTLSPELREILLKRRNAKWAGWLEKRLEQPGTSFVAVGAGHLAGPDSVQRYLKDRGLKVKRVQ
jgi:uncharacterized protein